MQCAVPGCTNPREEEDCCKFHSVHRHSAGALRNDGIIDWVAIELATEGARLPRLTWVEREIAAAIMLSRGMDRADVCARLNLRWDNPKRRERVLNMAKVIERDGLHV
jgi:hypothetical protein